jgi:hypothetical protein
MALATDGLPKQLLVHHSGRSIDHSTDWLSVRMSNLCSGEFLNDRPLADNNVFCQLIGSTGKECAATKVRSRVCVIFRRASQD